MYFDSTLIVRDVCTCAIYTYIVQCKLKLHVYMYCFALFVCLTLLASFFLHSHLSFSSLIKNMYIHLPCRLKTLLMRRWLAPYLMN